MPLRCKRKKGDVRLTEGLLAFKKAQDALVTLQNAQMDIHSSQEDLTQYEMQALFEELDESKQGFIPRTELSSTFESLLQAGADVKEPLACLMEPVNGTYNVHYEEFAAAIALP